MRLRTIHFILFGIALLCCAALWTQFRAARIARLRAEATEAKGHREATHLRKELELAVLGNVELSRELTRTAEEIAAHRAFDATAGHVVFAPQGFATNWGDCCT